MKLPRQTRFAGRQDGGAPWRWAVTGVLCGLLGAVVLFAPANWLASGIAQASAGRTLLEDARGTLWSGSARLTLTGGAGSPEAATLPGRLAWQVSPGVSGLRLEIRSDCCLPQPWVWQLKPGWGRATLALSDARSHWPAQMLGGLGTPWNTVKPEGQLMLSTQAFALTWVAGRLQVGGQAVLDANEISSRLSTLRPMGSYRFMLSGGPTPGLLLSTLQGALQLSGQGQWVGNKLRFVGEASAAPAALDALSNLLNIIGRREGARSIIKVG